MWTWVIVTYTRVSSIHCFDDSQLDRKNKVNDLFLNWRTSLCSFYVLSSKFDDISQIMSSGSYWPGLKNDTLKWRETWPMKSARSSFFLDTAQLQVSSAVRAPCLPVCSGSESGTFWCLGSLNRTAGVTTSQTMMSTVTETGTQMNDCTANKSQISLRTFLVCLNGQIKGYWDYIRWGYNKNYWHQCQLSAIN